jgi:hypothetical protein
MFSDFDFGVATREAFATTEPTTGGVEGGVGEAVTVASVGRVGVCAGTASALVTVNSMRISRSLSKISLL